MKIWSRILIILGVLVVIAFLIAQDLAWSGKLEVKTDFLRFTPYFSVIKPQERVMMGNGVNYVKAEPIFFDLYLPRDFDQAKVEVEYKDEFGYKILLGPNLKNGSPRVEAGWDSKALTDLPGASNDYKIKSVDFALADKNINGGKLRFMISIPDFKEGNGIFIKSVKITLTRQPLWQGNLTQNLLSYFTYVKNQF
jgi:hypothetical protein